MKDFSQKAFSDLAGKIGAMCFVLMFLSFAFTSQTSAAIVINEIYGAGGNSGASFNQDFVELYNNGATAVDISGYSLQYLSGNGTGSFAVCNITATDTVIESGTYFLISASAVGGTGANLPTPNANCNSLGLAATAGKIALLSNNSALSGAACPPVAPTGSTIIDFVGYGTSATVNCFEGTGPAIPPTSGNTNSTQRKGLGQDTQDNTADFERISPPTPMAGGLNPTVSLTVTPATASETGQTQLIATVTASVAVTGDQTVNFALTSGTAGTADFVSIPATITILSGQTTGSATFNVFDDSLVEGAESATFTISTPSSGITLGTTTTASVSITDNDVAPPSQLTFTVTRTDDRNNPTCELGDCSLREAVNAANTFSSNDTINFAAGVTTITLANEIVINNAGTLTISGPGANVLTINGGAGTNRIFTTSLATVTITGVTLTDGNGTGVTSSGNGGAIFVQAGTLVLDGVHINLNSATTGGGVYFAAGTNHQILNSTFSVNSAGNCGGFFNDNSNLTVTNSTISGNPVTNKGGGFCSNSNTTLRSVTITGNSATVGGGGIYHLAGTLDLGNTIVAGNTGGSPQDILLEGGTVTTAGYNLIGNNSSVAATFPAGNPNVNNDIVGTSGASVNPGLAPLANYGGTTPTHALLFSSPAIDKGNRFGLTTDQRGLLRPVNLDDTAYPNAADGSDIGAFESQLAPTAATVSLSGQVLTANGGGIMNIRLSLTDSLGNVRTATTDSSGNYRFDDVQTGETYILSATGKRTSFNQPVQVLNINEETSQVNFIGKVEKRVRSF